MDEEPRWQPGDHITVRTIWHGRIHSAHPMVVVEDDGDMLVGYLVPGQLFKRPFYLEGPAAGEQARVPEASLAWELRDEPWRGHGSLRFFQRGAAHSVIAFLSPQDVDRWYVNLEDPPTRTPIGIDTRDHMVDLVFTTDLASFRWKDLDELDEALALGVVTAEEGAAFRAEGERVIELMRDGHPAVQERWRTWSPSPGWTVPVLPPGWDRV